MTVVLAQASPCKSNQNTTKWGTSLVVQWLRLRTPSAGGPSSIPGQGTRSHMPQIKIPHAVAKTRCSQINKCLKKYNKVRCSHDTKKKDDGAHGKLVAIHIHPHAVHIFFLFCTLKKKTKLAVNILKLICLNVQFLMSLGRNGNIWLPSFQGSISLGRNSCRLLNDKESTRQWVWSLCWGDPLEKEMATHSSFLAWRIPWLRSLEGYSPWGSQRVRHGHTHTHTCPHKHTHCFSPSPAMASTTLVVSHLQVEGARSCGPGKACFAHLQHLPHLPAFCLWPLTCETSCKWLIG